jgi:hypothetical protein
MSFRPMSFGWIVAHVIAVYLLLANMAVWALLVTGMVEIVPGVGWVVALVRWVTE